jgi:hypothetical protein
MYVVFCKLQHLGDVHRRKPENLSSDANSRKNRDNYLKSPQITDAYKLQPIYIREIVRAYFFLHATLISLPSKYCTHSWHVQSGYLIRLHVLHPLLLAHSGFTVPRLVWTDTLCNLHISGPNTELSSRLPWIIRHAFQKDRGTESIERSVNQFLDQLYHSFLRKYRVYIQRSSRHWRQLVSGYVMFLSS